MSKTSNSVISIRDVLTYLGIVLAAIIFAGTVGITIPSKEPDPIRVIHSLIYQDRPIRLRLLIPKHPDNIRFCLWFGVPYGGERPDAHGNYMRYFTRSCRQLNREKARTPYEFEYPTGYRAPFESPPGVYTVGAQLYRRPPGQEEEPAINARNGKFTVRVFPYGH